MSNLEQPEAGGLACGPVRERLAAFLAGELSRDRQDELRAHVSRCASCRAAFEAGVGLAAHLHRQPRQAREDEARAERRRAQRARALAAAMRLPGSDRGARLRLLLLPAFAVFLFTVVARGPRPQAGVRLSALGGSVQLGPQALDEPGVSRRLQSGQLCATGADGRARLEAPDGSAELEPGTWVWLEDAEGPRLRIGGGELVARGRATLTSRVGVVEVHGGAARVRVSATGLRVEALQGETTVADSRGAQTVRAGGRLELGASQRSRDAGTPRYRPR